MDRETKIIIAKIILVIFIFSVVFIGLSVAYLAPQECAKEDQKLATVWNGRTVMYEKEQGGFQEKKVYEIERICGDGNSSWFVNYDWWLESG